MLSTFLTLILTLLKKYWKPILVVSLISILSLSTLVLYNSLKEQKDTSDRYYDNLKNSSFKIQQLEAKDKSSYYEINQLTLKKNEFEVLVPHLYSEIKNLNSKLKNVNNITTVDIVYDVKIDTIYIDTIPKINTFNYKDSFVVFKGEVDYKNNILKNVNLTVIDSLIFIQEVRYKRYWIFWKKPIGTKLKIKSENPYLMLLNVESYNLDF